MLEQFPVQKGPVRPHLDPSVWDHFLVQKQHGVSGAGPQEVCSKYQVRDQLGKFQPLRVILAYGGSQSVGSKRPRGSLVDWLARWFRGCCVIAPNLPWCISLSP